VTTVELADVAAWVGDRAIPVTLIEQRLAALRSGPYAARLPQPGTAEWRNLRRWLVQAVSTEAVIDHEAGVRGIAIEPPDGPARPLTLAEALRVGGVTAAIIAAYPLAVALRRHVVPEVPVPDSESYAYFSRNRDRYPRPYNEVRDDIAVTLSRDEHDRRFARWLDERCAALVRLQPGFEHPSDPHHPDAVHRH
jgi:[acyl-carrier-protein] S-malonyltransferase